MKRGPELGFDDTGEPILITRAEVPYEEQHRARVRKYLMLMAFRIPALLLAAMAYGAWHNGLICLAIIALSIPLPWMAVLIANDRPPRRIEEPRRFDDAQHRTPLFPTAERPALEHRIIEHAADDSPEDGSRSGGKPSDAQGDAPSGNEPEAR